MEIHFDDLEFLGDLEQSLGKYERQVTKYASISKVNKIPTLFFFLEKHLHNLLDYIYFQCRSGTTKCLKAKSVWQVIHSSWPRLEWFLGWGTDMSSLALFQLVDWDWRTVLKNQGGIGLWKGGAIRVLMWWNFMLMVLLGARQCFLGGGILHNLDG